MIDTFDLRPPGQKLVDLSNAGLGDAVKLAQPPAVLHGVDGEASARLQPAQDRVEGRLRDLDAAGEVLDDLIAVGVPPPQDGQDADVQESPLELWVDHCHTPFHAVLYNAQYHLSRGFFPPTPEGALSGAERPNFSHLDPSSN